MSHQYANDDLYARRRSYADGEVVHKKRKSLTGLATIVPTEDKFQKLKNVRLAGFAFLARTTNWYARAFWLIVICLAFGFLIYEVYKTIHDFINNPTITTYVLTPLDEMPFPKLFICPSIAVTKAYLNSDQAKANAAREFLELVQLAVRGTNSTILPSITPTGDSGEQMRDEVLRMGLSTEQLFKSCQFYGNSSDYEDIDCFQIVTPIFDQRFGKCFSVDIKRNQSTDGKGLSLHLNTQTVSESVDDKNFIKEYQGIFLTIDSDYQPSSNDYVLVPSGSYTKLALSLTYLSFLNLRSGALIQPCAEGDKAQLGMLKARFTPASCRLECQMNESMSECQCIPAVNGSILMRKDVRICPTGVMHECVRTRLAKSESLKRVDKCRELCITPCDDARFETSTSGAPLNPDAFEKSDKVEELIILDIAFEHVETANFSQTSSMTFDFFVGNMGGQITLWIGGCMLTLLPLPLSIIAFCCMAGVIRIKRLVKGSKDVQ